MATMTIRNVPDEVRDEIRVAAAKNGRSMEAEVRHRLVKSTLESGHASSKDLGERLRRVQEDFVRHATDDLSVERFLAERRAMWGED